MTDSNRFSNDNFEHKPAVPRRIDQDIESEIDSYSEVSNVYAESESERPPGFFVPIDNVSDILTQIDSLNESELAQLESRFIPNRGFRRRRKITKRWSPESRRTFYSGLFLCLSPFCLTAVACAYSLVQGVDATIAFLEGGVLLATANRGFKNAMELYDKSIAINGKGEIQNRLSYGKEIDGHYRSIDKRG